MEWVTSFSTESVWKFVTELLVPLTAVVAATMLVLRQIRQLDRHRTQDRQTEGINELVDYFYAEVELANDRGTFQRRTMIRMSNEKIRTRAFGLLGPENIDVVLWAADVRSEIRKHIDEATFEETVGCARSEAAKIAVEAVEKLIQWDRGEIKTEWFTSTQRD